MLRHWQERVFERKVELIVRTRTLLFAFFSVFCHNSCENKSTCSGNITWNPLHDQCWRQPNPLHHKRLTWLTLSVLRWTTNAPRVAQQWKIGEITNTEEKSDVVKEVERSDRGKWAQTDNDERQKGEAPLFIQVYFSVSQETTDIAQLLIYSSLDAYGGWRKGETREPKLGRQFLFFPGGKTVEPIKQGLSNPRILTSFSNAKTGSYIVPRGINRSYCGCIHHPTPIDMSCSITAHCLKPLAISIFILPACLMTFFSYINVQLKACKDIFTRGRGTPNGWLSTSGCCLFIPFSSWHPHYAGHLEIQPNWP